MSGVSRLSGICLALSIAFGASATVAETPTPAVSPAAAARCAVHVDQVVTLDGNRAVVGLGTYGDAGMASGTVRLFANGAAYDIPFTNVVVPHVYAEKAVAIVPLVVRFPARVTLDAAIVSSVGTPPLRCPVADPWVALPPGRTPSRALTDLQNRWRDLAAGATPVDAPPPTPLPPTPCYEPFRSWHFMTSPSRPPRDILAVNSATLMTVEGDGSATAETYVSTGDAKLDAAVTQYFGSLRWAPAEVLCVPVATTFPILFGPVALTTDVFIVRGVRR